MREKRNTSKILSTLIICFSTLLISNCGSDVNFGKFDIKALGFENFEENLEEVRTSCLDRNHQTKTVEFFFEDPKVTCEFGQNGNLKRRDRYFQARIEQTLSAGIDSKMVICDMSFNFENQKFLYDDHFLMTFDNIVMASSYRVETALPVYSGLIRYLWPLMVGIQWKDSLETVYCLGDDRDLSECSWPDTDKEGRISMSFNKSVIEEAMAANLDQKQHFISFVSIGDDNDLDCEHSDLRFSITYDYIERK